MEIHAFDYAVVEITSALQRLFTAKDPASWLWSVQAGLDVESETSLGYASSVIKPVRWRHNKGQIFVRFQRTAEGWQAYEGHVLFCEPLPSGHTEFIFKCDQVKYGEYRFQGRGP